MLSLKSKSSIKYPKLVVYLWLLLPFLLLLSCYGNKQIVIAESLHTNSEKWKATTKGGEFSIGRTNFGPYKTINSSKLDSAKLKTKSYSFWNLHVFAHDEVEKQRKVYSLDITHTKDTAKVLLYVNITNQLHFQGLFSILDKDTNNAIREANGKMVINNSKDFWQFVIFPYGVDNFRWYETKGMLWHQNDTIAINPISNFMNVKQDVLFTAHTKGITLSQKGETIAALQILGNNYVWIRKDLPSDTQLIIAGLFSTIIGTKDL